MSGYGTTRRGFLKAVGAGVCALSAARVLAQDSAAPSEAGAARPQAAVHDARWFDRLADKAVQCRLCPRECTVADQERGYCGVRENRGGDYKTLVYGALCTINIDPIEKKPLFHYLPGTAALSVATAYLDDRPNWQRIVLVAMGVPIAVICNVLRVVTTSTMYYLDRPELGHGFMHTFTGMLMLAPALLMLWGLSWLLRNLFVEAEDEPDEPGSQTGPDARPEGAAP